MRVWARRYVLRGLAAAGVGIVTTFAVAWGPWFFAMPRTVYRVDRGLAVVDGLIVDLMISRVRGGEAQMWQVRDPMDGAWDSADAVRRAERITRIGGAKVHEWLDDALSQVVLDGRAYPPIRRIDHIAARGVPTGLLDGPVWPGGTIVNVARRGWPLRAVESMSRLDMEHGPLNEHGVPTSSTPVITTRGEWKLPWGPIIEGPLPPGTKMVLPVKMIWSGVVVDSVVFGAGWWVAVAAMVLVRRRLRLLRGVCAGCGYDLAGQVVGGCPECGLGRDVGGG